MSGPITSVWPPVTRALSDDCLQLDARRWAREGLLQRPCSGVWQWTDGAAGHRVASISFRIAIGQVLLSFSCHDQARLQMVPIFTTRCNFGGVRHWFGCPSCGRRVAVLYLRGCAFGCRGCCNVGYTCQTENRLDRVRRKQAKLEQLLLCGEGKPKGMRWKTYERIRAAIVLCDTRRNAELLSYIARVTKRIARSDASEC